MVDFDQISLFKQILKSQDFFEVDASVLAACSILKINDIDEKLKEEIDAEEIKIRRKIDVLKRKVVII